MKNNPILGGTAGMAILVHGAYQTLSSPEKRSEYDQYLLWKQSKRSISDLNKQGAIKKGTCPLCEENTDGSLSLFDGNQCPVCGKPIRGKPYHTSQTSEQRKVNRLRKEGSLTYQYFQSKKNHPGKLIDLSSKGVRFVSDVKMSQSLELKIESPLLKGTARITNCREFWWQNSPIYFVGARFTTIEFHRSCGTFLSIKV